MGAPGGYRPDGARLGKYSGCDGKAVGERVGRRQGVRPPSVVQRHLCAYVFGLEVCLRSGLVGDAEEALADCTLPPAVYAACDKDSNDWDAREAFLQQLLGDLEVFTA